MNYDIIAQIKDYFIAMFPALIMGILVYSLPFIVSSEPFILFIIQILMGMLVYSLICLKKYKHMIKSLVSIIQNKTEF
jgi:hypothetical protein